MYLRRVTSTKDFDEIVDLQELTLSGDVPMKPAEKGWWWLMSDEQGSVAFAGLTPSSRWYDTAYLCRAGVDPLFRGHGLQKRLIKARVNYARRLGYRWLISDTAPGNHASANSLASCGFRMYEPAVPFGLRGALYWRKRINP